MEVFEDCRWVYWPICLFWTQEVFSNQNSPQVYVKVDLTRDHLEFMDINISEEDLYQWVEYIGLPNTYYYFQSFDHKIHNWPLIMGRFYKNPSIPLPSSWNLTSQNKDQEDEWSPSNNHHNQYPMVYEKIFMALPSASSSIALAIFDM